MQFIVLLFDGRPAGVDAPHKVPARLSATPGHTHFLQRLYRPPNAKALNGFWPGQAAACFASSWSSKYGFGTRVVT
jgi:hypothetical protein